MRLRQTSLASSPITVPPELTHALRAEFVSGKQDLLELDEQSIPMEQRSLPMTS
jgi:hypothetical protein